MGLRLIVDFTNYHNDEEGGTSKEELEKLIREDDWYELTQYGVTFEVVED